MACKMIALCLALMWCLTTADVCFYKCCSDDESGDSSGMCVWRQKFNYDIARFMPPCSYPYGFPRCPSDNNYWEVVKDGALYIDMSEDSEQYYCAELDGESSMIYMCMKDKARIEKRELRVRDIFDKPPLHKCCPKGQYFDLILAACADVKVKVEYTPLIYSPGTRSFIPTNVKRFSVSYQLPNCTNFTLLSFKDLSIPSFVLFDNGSLWVELAGSTLLTADEYCVDAAFWGQGPQHVRIALVCLREDICESKVCVKKCCGNGASYNSTMSTCMLTDSPWSVDNLTDGFSVRTIPGFPRCEESEVFIIHQPESLSPNGSLIVGPNIYAPGNFCLETVLDYSGELLALSCAPVLIEEITTDWRFTWYPASLIISVLFLIATLISGCLLPKSRLLHGRCQTNHIISLLFGYILLTINQLGGSSLPYSFCITIAVFMHFSFLATFFWLNTMCINIWWTFRDLRPASLDKEQESQRFYFYSGYAWGSAVLISGIAILLDVVPQVPDSILKPKFGEKHCWFYGDMEILAYFYGPVGVLIIVNIILFAATAWELSCGFWKREVKTNSNGNNSEQFTLGKICLKLVVVMGITWIFDVLSWMVGGPEYIWYISDIMNALQGVFIFIVVGCQPQAWAALKRCWNSSGPKDTTGPTSSSLHGNASLEDLSSTTPSTKAGESAC